jgi:phosphopantetheinyl transferase
LVSEPKDVIGVDVMEMQIPQRRNPDVKEFFTNMENCFTPFEWKNIRHSSDPQKQVQQFFRHWTLKEGFFFLIFNFFDLI